MPENPMTAGSGGGGSGAGLPHGFNFPHFSPFGGLPLDPSHHQRGGGGGQNMWESHAAAAAARFHALHGLSVSGSGPSLSELSLLAGRRSGGEGGGIPSGILGGTPTPGVTGSAAELHAAAAAAYSRLTPYMDPLYTGLHTSPTGSIRLSPIDSRGSTGLGMPPDYMSVAASAGFCPRSLSDLHPGASTLSSAELAYVYDNARFASPRASVNARANRKRALSCSPYSDSFDIRSIVQFAPSLVSLVNGSRGSSAASGSYGHLSAGTMSPALGMGSGLSAGFSGGMPPLQQLQAHLLRSGPLAGSLPGSPFLHHAGLYNSPFSAHQSLYMPTLQHSLNIKQEGESCPKSSPGVGAVSSTMEVDEHRINTRKIKVRREPATTTSRSNCDDRGEGDGMKDDEPGDFYETNCHWTGCSMEFCTQEELVTHINTDHIHANKKVFICRWKDCSREEKPFKAQYMLVVHMRRHTGEKPHRCTFEGCLKAYSRLENLKTHLRSHTGEKPYTCEYPGCIKAFSNASDRAKHQNRTHSNEKPYVCKAPGCTKRYTDPSSLRKHVKTVHGADFYASKKHKGNDHGSGHDHDHRNGKGSGHHNGSAESPRSEDMGSKTTSISSPSIKSEDPNSPHQQSSPGGDSSGTEINGVEPMEEPISDNNVSTTNEMSDAGSGYDNSPMMMHHQNQHHNHHHLQQQQQMQQQPCWDLKEEVEVLPEMLGIGVRMDVGVGVGGGGGGGGHHPEEFYGSGRYGDGRRFPGRMGAKGFGYAMPMPSMPAMVDTHGPRRNLGIENLNRRITDLKMDQGPPSSNQPGTGSCQNLAGIMKPPGSDLSPRLPNPHMTTIKTPQDQNSATRRDSGNSTLSSYHSSMRSDGGGQYSRRSSSISQTSNQNQVAGNNPGHPNHNRQLVNSSPYDPISPGSSRRSSALESDSLTESNPMINSLASSSNTLTLTSSAQAQAHLERLHRRALGLDEKENGGGTSHDKNGSQNTLTSSGNYLIQSQTAAARLDASWVGNMSIMMRSSANASGEMRRMSDPCTSMNQNGGGNRIPLSSGMNYVTPSQLTQALQRHQQQQGQGGQAPGFVNNNPGQPAQNASTVPTHGQNTTLEGSMGDDFLIPDDMANYLSECQGQRFGYPSNMDPTRPSTCPPPNSGYPVPMPQQQPQNPLPPPPSYNQAVGVGGAVCPPAFGHNNNLNQHSVVPPSVSAIQNRNRAFVPIQSGTSSHLGNQNNYPSSPMSMNICSPAPSGSPCHYNNATSCAVPSPYNQPIPSPAFSQHSSSVMSPKRRLHPNNPMVSPNVPPSPRNLSMNPASPQIIQAHPQQSSSYGPYHGQNNYPTSVECGHPCNQGQTQNAAGFYPQSNTFANNTSTNTYNNPTPQAYSQTYGTASGAYPQPQPNAVNFPQNYHTQNQTSYPQHLPSQPNQTQTFTRPNLVTPINRQQPTPPQCQYTNTNPQWNSATVSSNSNITNPRYFNGTGPWPNNNSNSNTSGYFPHPPQQAQPQVQVVPVSNPTKRGGRGGNNPEIQCKSVTSQSQQSKMLQHQQQNGQHLSGTVPNTNGTGPVQGMRPEAYQRTLEYVQQCQQQMWVNKESASGTGTATGGGDHSNPLSPDSTTDPQHQQQQHSCKSPNKPPPMMQQSSNNCSVTENQFLLQNQGQIIQHRN